jgi:AraC-like DNA-binding protein
VASRFQELITSPADGAKLFSWGARAVYAGPVLGLTPHRNAVAVVAIGVDEPFLLARDPVGGGREFDECRTALIKPNTLHHLTGTQGRMGFVYLDACSREATRLAEQARISTPRSALHLSSESELLDVFRGLDGTESSWRRSKAALSPLLGPRDRERDPRIGAALALMHAQPAARPSLDHLASTVGLSNSHFMRLFTASTGVPLRRYRIWVAVGAAMRAIARGDTLTEAAFDAGFSSSAHFSSTFRQMFGLEPSRLRGAVIGGLGGTLESLADRPRQTREDSILVPSFDQCLAARASRRTTRWALPPTQRRAVGQPAPREPPPAC